MNRCLYQTSHQIGENVVQVSFGVVRFEDTTEEKTEIEWQLGQDLSHSPHQIRRSFIQLLHERWETNKNAETLPSSLEAHQYFQHIVKLGYEISEIECSLDTLQDKYQYHLLLSQL